MDAAWTRINPQASSILPGKNVYIHGGEFSGVHEIRSARIPLCVCGCEHSL